MSEYFRKTFKIEPLPTFEEGQVEIIVHQIQGDAAKARLRPGDPLDVMNRSVVSGLRLLADLGVAIDGKLRVGAEAIANVLRAFKEASDAERSVIAADTAKAEASLKLMVATAHNALVKRIDHRSEQIADLKIKAALKSTVYWQNVGCALLFVVGIAAGFGASQAYNRAIFEVAASDLYKAATMYGPDRLDAWLRIMRPNDPIPTWGPCYAGQTSRSTTGREVCEVATWRGPPAPPK